MIFPVYLVRMDESGRRCSAFKKPEDSFCKVSKLSETSPFAVIKGLTFSMNWILSERFDSMVDQSTGLTFNLFAVALSVALGVSVSFHFPGWLDADEKSTKALGTKQALRPPLN